MPVVGTIIKRAVHFGTKLPQPRKAPMQYQEQTLRRLLRKANNTAFGKHYKFKRILKSEDIVREFQDNIPIHDYNKIHDEWWYRTLKEETNVCWPGKIKVFALSSGTTNSPSKHIPVTKDMMRSMRRAGVRMLFSFLKNDVDESIYTSDMMMLGGSTDLMDKGGYAVGDLSGINASKLPFWLRRFYKPGTEISKLRDWNERLDEIAKNAPKWNVGFIMGIPAWVQLMIEKIISYHNVETIHDIWPNFQIYVTGGVSFEPYRKGFSKLLGKPVTFLDTYLASEGFISIQTSVEKKPQGMELLLNNGIFLEFIPFNEENFDEDGQLQNNPKTLTINEVKEGVDYALLVTTCAGAWRYLIGDTIRFSDLSVNEIIITGRTKHFLSICGEHLSIDNMNNAIQLLEEDLDITVREFTVSGVKHNNFFAHKWYIGCEESVDAELVKAKLDEKLIELNDDYATERSNVLGMFVEVIPSNVFYNWHEKKGKLGGQTKFPRVMKKDQFQEWEIFVKNELLVKE